MNRKTLWAVAGCCLLSGSVPGAGFQLYTEGSAEALGLAGAISGREDLVSQAWYNPSALAGTDRAAVMVGSAFVQINTVFSGPTGSASMADDWRIIPHLYGVLPVSSAFTALLSVNAPYGLITEWPVDWVGNTFATYTELQTIYTTPSIACKVGDWMKLSVGFNVVYADAELSSAGQTLEGDGIGYGYTASIHLRPLEDWSAGGRYQSRVALGMDGDISVGASVLGGAVDVTLPSSATLGIANRSVRNLVLGLDVVWSEWSTYDQLAIETPFGTTVIPKDWDNVWSFRAGGEYALSDALKVRGGYVWDESPVPDTTRTPELPGADRQMVMAGIGWTGGRIGVDLAYSYLWSDPVGMGSLYSLKGEFDTDSRIASISLRYSF